MVLRQPEDNITRVTIFSETNIILLLICLINLMTSISIELDIKISLWQYTKQLGQF